MSNAALVQDETEDRYYTQVEEGDVRLFTLDQLDAAFNAGLIHENTYVCLEGDSKWLTLAEVAGLGDEGDEEPVSAPHLIAAAAPQAPAPAYSAPAPAAPAYSVPAPAPVSHVASGPFGLAPVTNSIAPMTNSVAPMVMPSIAPAFSNSLALDDDLELMAMRRKRAPLGKILAAVAVLGLGGVAFAVVQSGGVRLPKLNDSAGQASAASLSISSLKQAETKTETPPPAPAPVAEAAKPEPAKEEAKAAESSDSAGKKQGEDRFSEDMKAALLAKDKDSKDKKSAAGKKAAAKKAGRAVAARTGGKAKASGGGAFKSSGNAYDPLNGKL